jgi:hypothetical protein
MRPPGIRPERKPFRIAFTPTPAISAASAHGIIPEPYESRRSTMRRTYGGGLEASTDRSQWASATGRSELRGMRQHPAHLYANESVSSDLTPYELFTDPEQLCCLDRRNRLILHTPTKDPRVAHP